MQRLAQDNLASKNDIANFVKKSDFDDILKDLDKKFTSNKTKHILAENELNKLLEKIKAISTNRLTKDFINKFIILNGSKNFYSGILQNYFVFISAKKYIKYFSGTTRIYSWKSNRVSDESIENITKLVSKFARTFVNHYLLPEMNFNGHCLINNNISFPEKVIDLYISYILSPCLRNLNTDFTLNNCSFGYAYLAKNSDPDKFKYSGYGIRFDSPWEFPFTDGGVEKKCHNC